MLRTLLDRPVSVTMVMLVAVVLGLVSVRLLPVSLIPEVDIPYVTVQVSSPQRSVREIDEGAVNVLRQQLMQLDGLEDLTAESRDGVGTIRLTFSHGTDMDYAFVAVNEKIDRSMGSLPDDVGRPKVLKSSATDIPAFYINLTLPDGTDDDFYNMSRFAQDVICKRIEQQTEVAMVDISGFVDDQIMIIPDQKKLAQLGLDASQFESIINSSNVNLGSLTIRDGQYRYSVKFLSSVSSVEDIADVRFRYGDRIFQIRDVATVTEQPAKCTGLVRSDGKRAVTLAVIKQSDAKMHDLKETLEGLMDNFTKDYPEIDFTVTRDQTQLLEYSINNLIQNIVAGVLLACIIIFLFMRDFRSPALVSLTMPVALVFSMAIFYVSGISLNIISLSGLLLGVGMMADNTIILVDNITSRWQRGENLRDAVVLGTREVAGPMLSSVLTTCAVFIPLVFVNGIAGELFYDQAMAVTIVLLTSYAVTLTVIPVYYYRWYRNMPSFVPSRLLEKISFDESLVRWDHKIMGWFLDHTKVSWVVLALSAVGAVVCLVFMPKERLPEMTYTETIMLIDWNSQISVEENEHRITVLEELVREDCEQITSMVGMQRFVLSHSEDLGVSEASVYMKCHDMQTLEGVRRKLESAVRNAYPSASFRFEVSGNIFDAVFADTEAPLMAKVSPVSELNVEGVRNLLSDLRGALPGVYIDDVAVKSDVMFVADPDKMTLYGVSYSDLSGVIQTALNENRLFSLAQGVRNVPVLIGTESENLSEILSEVFVSKNGVRIPVSEFMRQTYVEDFKTLSSNAGGEYYPLPLDITSSKVPEVIEAVEDTVRGYDEYEVSFGGSWFSNRMMVRDMSLVLVIAIILLYLILASQFESLVQPVIILSEIVIDIFASLLVLWIMGLTVNLMSMIGLVVVSGIVINDSILKVDTINNLRAEGLPLRAAITEASGRRMKAIIMTSLTTILAVVPFLTRGNMGDDLQYPMSIVIIVGMSIGTLVSLFILPALYYTVCRKPEE